MGREVLVRLVTRGLCLAALCCAFVAQSIPASAEPVHESLLGAVNAYRAARGLATVVASPSLMAAAQFMANDIERYGAPAIPHRSSDGRTARQRMADAGYPVSQAFTSEIIAWGTTTADGAMRLWINSPAHWAELNDGRYRAAGFGVACGGTWPCAWVVTFGSIVDQTYDVAERHAAFYAQSAYPTVAPGESAEWVIAFTNTGNVGWDLSQATALRLGTWSPQDAPSMLASPAWITRRTARRRRGVVGQQPGSAFCPGADRAWDIPAVRATVIDGANARETSAPS